jgi:argininosuccinate lyase
MTSKLWSKGYDLLPTLERYCAARNAALDGALARQDVWGSLAHSRMLRHVGLLTEEEGELLHDALCSLLREADAGALVPTAADEDIHTLIERLLVERIGAVGKKVHIGRSRNDQALVDVRLYAKEALLDIAACALDVASKFLAMAQEHQWVPMPGYTHMQRGMLSSVGLWAAAHAEALLDDCIALETAYRLNDQCPLGSAAAYGAPLPLDRDQTANLLGFAAPHHNVLTAANSRGKIEAATVQELSLIMLDLSKFAQDVLLFTTSEFAFFDAPPELCDGSSIMPQKRNLSPLELVRARAQTLIALQGQMLSTLAGLPSGYNMDFQETKGPLLEACAICHDSLEVVGLYAAHLQPNHQALADACTAELFATDHAYELAEQGMPFRDAYRIVAANPTNQEPGDLVARLHARTAIGSPGNLQLGAIERRMHDLQVAWQTRRDAFTSALAGLLAGEDESSAKVAGPNAGPNASSTASGSLLTASVALGI